MVEEGSARPETPLPRLRCLTIVFAARSSGRLAPDLGGFSTTVGMEQWLLALSSPVLTHLHLAEVPVGAASVALRAVGHLLSTFQFTNFAEFFDLGLIYTFCPRSLRVLRVAARGIVNSSGPSRIPRGQLYDIEDVFVNVHCSVPERTWADLMVATLGRAKALEMTSCEGLTDSTLASAISACEVLSGSRLGSFVMKGRHRGEVKLTDRTVHHLFDTFGQLEVVGDCSTWSMSNQDLFMKKVTFYRPPKGPFDPIP